jgi:hypothetical protein
MGASCTRARPWYGIKERGETYRNSPEFRKP